MDPDATASDGSNHVIRHAPVSSGIWMVWPACPAVAGGSPGTKNAICTSHRESRDVHPLICQFASKPPWTSSTGVAAPRARAGADPQRVPEPRALLERPLRLVHDEADPLVAPQPHELRGTEEVLARALEELQVVRVVDEPREVRVLVVDAQRPGVH